MPGSPSPLARSTPAGRQSSPSQELASLDAWAANGQAQADESGEFDTSVVPKSRRRLKLTLGILMAAGVAVAALFVVNRLGAAGKVSPGASALQSGSASGEGATAAVPVQPAETSAPPAPTAPPVAAPESPPNPAAVPESTGASAAAPKPSEASNGAAGGAGKLKADGIESAEPPASYDKLVADADRLLENGGTDRALKLYERALKLQPGGVEALTGMAYTALDKDKVALAVGYFERALTQAPSYGPAMFGLAEALRAQGNESRALEGYRRYLQINASGADAPAARRQLRLLEDKLSAADSGRVAAPPPSGPPPSPSSVLNEAEAP